MSEYLYGHKLIEKIAGISIPGKDIGVSNKNDKDRLDKLVNLTDDKAPGGSDLVFGASSAGGLYGVTGVTGADDLRLEHIKNVPENYRNSPAKFKAGLGALAVASPYAVDKTRKGVERAREIYEEVT